MSNLLLPLFGGALIGLSAVIILLFNGRIAGVSGIVSGLLSPTSGDTGWRVSFVGGIVVAGLLLAVVLPQSFVVTDVAPPLVIIAAGLLVGFGARLGNGCTSGHGVCGISRLSARSIVATLTFISTAAIAVLVYRTLFGGVS